MAADPISTRRATTLELLPDFLVATVNVVTNAERPRESLDGLRLQVIGFTQRMVSVRLRHAGTRHEEKVVEGLQPERQGVGECRGKPVVILLAAEVFKGEDSHPGLPGCGVIKQVHDRR